MSDNADDLIISISTDQATLRRSIQRIEGDLAKLAGGVQQKFAPVGKAIEDAISTPLQQRINAMIGIGTKASKEWTGALADQGAELERLRAKYNPLFATITQYKTVQSDLRKLYGAGTIGIEEYTAAMSRERTAALASIAALKTRNAVIADTPTQRMVGGYDPNSQFRRQNLGYQAFDIGQGIASGLPLPMILAQQGPQIAQLYAGQGGLKAALSDVTSIAGATARALGPIGIALAAIGAAAGAYFLTVHSDSEKAAADLKKHIDDIETLARAWGDQLPAVKAYYDSLKAAQDLREQTQAKDVTEKKYWEDASTQANAAYIAFQKAFDVAESTGKIEVFSTARRDFIDLQQKMREHAATLQDVQKVTGDLNDVAGQFPKKVIDQAIAAFKLLEPEIDTAKDKTVKLNNEFGKLGGLRPMQVQDIIHNRGPFAPVPENGPIPEFRAPVELEGLPGEKDAGGSSANEKASTAYRDLIKSASDRIAQMQQEIDLVGKYGVEVDTARFKLELLQQAEDRGRKLSPEQRKELDEKVELYGKMAEALAKVKLQQDLMEDRRLSLLSPQDRQIAETLKQYGLPSDNLNSPQAQQIRQSLQYADIKDGVKTFLTDFQSALVSNGGDIGKAFGQALLNAANNQLQKQLDAIFDRIASSIANALTGGPSSTNAGLAGAAGKVISSVNDNAANLAAKIAPTLHADGLINVPPAAANSTVAATGDIAAQIKQLAIEKGMNPADVLRVANAEGGTKIWNQQSWAKNSSGLREPSYGPFQLLKGGPGTGYPTGLGNKFMEETGLDPADAKNGPAATSWAMDYAKKNGWSSWYGAKAAGMSKWQGINPGQPGIDPQTTNSVTSSMTKLSSTVTDASKNVGTFGTGLGDLGKNLVGAFPAAPAAPTSSGGGLFSWLGSLFGGFTPNGAQATAAFNGTLLPGLFAGGGHISGPGGPTDDRIPAWLSNGEFVVNAGMTRKHRALLEAINNGKVGRFADGGLVAPSLVPVPVAPALMPSGGGNAGNDNQRPELHVHVNGGSGDEHIRMLARQGAHEALTDYDKHQERGGIGTMQAKWAARKN